MDRIKLNIRMAEDIEGGLEEDEKASFIAALLRQVATFVEEGQGTTHQVNINEDDLFLEYKHEVDESSSLSDPWEYTHVKCLEGHSQGGIRFVEGNYYELAAYDKENNWADVMFPLRSDSTHFKRISMDNEKFLFVEQDDDDW